jgi:hypothetical protein
MNSLFSLKTFYKIIITVYELELAFSEWNNYILYDSQMLYDNGILNKGNI